MSDPTIGALPQSQTERIVALAQSIERHIDAAGVEPLVRINAVFAVAASCCLEIESNTNMPRDEIVAMVSTTLRSMMDSFFESVPHTHTH